MLKEAANVIIKKIDMLAVGKNCVIVGIDGRCASGKTTLASLIAEQVDCNVFHMDDFFLPFEKRTKERLAIPGSNSDRERFLEEVLIPLGNGKPVEYIRYDCSNDSFFPARTVPFKTISIVEGSYSLHPELRDYYDFSVFLTVENDEQLKRICARDGIEQSKSFVERWIPLEEKYFKAFNVAESSDMFFVSK